MTGIAAIAFVLLGSLLASPPAARAPVQRPDTRGPRAAPLHPGPLVA
jgi:hypothetical protein